MTPLLPHLAFNPVFTPLQGKRVGIVWSPGGNAGDRLIEMATLQLISRFGIDHRVVSDRQWNDCDLLVCGGGGNFGHPYCLPEMQRRREALSSGLPCVLLPQTAYGSEWGWESHRVYLRESGSLTYYPNGIVVPDLVMGFTPTVSLPQATEQEGRFFSSASEGLWGSELQTGDPRFRFVNNPEQYIAFAAQFKRIVTDCLHMAICGLISGREVYIVPSRLHKQRSMWETWLRHFGCKWANNPSEVH